MLDKNSIFLKEASEYIKNSEIVAFPTDTVYGLGGNALSDEACMKIYKYKNRPLYNPLIVHVQNLEQAKKLAFFNEDAVSLSKLWPGPLTMVLKSKKNGISKFATSSLDTIAIRIPNHPLALALIEKSQVPIAAPSANKSGFLSSTNYAHVKIQFPEENIYVLDNGKKNTSYGIESTVIDLSLSSKPTILRSGYITSQEIEKLLSKKISTTFILKSYQDIKSPGMLFKHYSTKSKIRLNASYVKDNEVGLDFGKKYNFQKIYPNIFSLNLSISSDLYEAAHNLFDYLNKLDMHAIKHKKSCIAIAPIPSENIGLAINERISRAAL